MSFMFNPFPYDDPNAINKLDDFTLCGKQAYRGNKAIKLALTKAIEEKIESDGYCRIGIDGYVTAPFAELAEIICSIEGINVETHDISKCFKDAATLDKLFEENLPMDKEKDPVLLYGKIFHGLFADIMDASKVEKIKAESAKANGKGVTVVFGNGALSEAFDDCYNLRIFADVTPKQTVLNIKKGGYRNYGNDKDIPFKATMRRCYYVDFELAFNNRWRNLKNATIDLYVEGTHPESMNIMSYDVMMELFSKGLDRPFRCRPVYLEGVWGGYYIQKERNLPKEMKNAAWVFDLIPMEVSIVYEVDGHEYEFPYYTLIQSCGEKLMGKTCMEMFGGYFPVRFNYDDTFHSSGNMSIQLHPGEKFLKENSNELGRQDESYYIVATAQGAKTYVGFNNDADVDEFLSEIKKSEKEHTKVDYEKYINYVDSVPGVQVMIPSGTIHASGRNQVILEIGSLTVGSYTYKMYDYLRKDLDGNPRPIHSYYGELNINKNAKRDWVMDNIVQPRRTVREGGNDESFYKEVIVGEHELLYFALRNLIFNEKIEDNTDGYFHVLTLVDGEEVDIISKADPSMRFTAKYLDMVVVPASLGEYEIVNKKPGTVITIHKTLLRK